jgi:hypothetical protein
MKEEHSYTLADFVGVTIVSQKRFLNSFRMAENPLDISLASHKPLSAYLH